MTHTVMAMTGVVAAIVVAVVYWQLRPAAPRTDQSVAPVVASPVVVAPVAPPVVTPPLSETVPASAMVPGGGTVPSGGTGPGSGTVAAGGTGKAGAAEPPTIKASIEDKLRGAGMLRGTNADDAGVTVADVGADGRVRLVGVLKDRAARQAAADLARTVTGVNAVDVSRVTVKEGWVSQ